MGLKEDWVWFSKAGKEVGSERDRAEQATRIGRCRWSSRGIQKAERAELLFFRGWENFIHKIRECGKREPQKNDRKNGLHPFYS